MSEILVLQIVVLLCGTTISVAALRFFRRYLELKHERRVPQRVEEMNIRFDRIEAIVEATALEVERISEANRFMSKLLAERTGPPLSPTRPERVITPH